MTDIVKVSAVTGSIALKAAKAKTGQRFSIARRDKESPSEFICFKDADAAIGHPTSLAHTYVRS